MHKVYILSRITIAIIFIYHGLVPKIIFANAHEILMNNALIPFLSEKFTLYISGIVEIVYGVVILVFFASKQLIYPAIVFLILSTLMLLAVLPNLFQNAFNPFSINLSLLVLCVINIISQTKTESASNK